MFFICRLEAICLAPCAGNSLVCVESISFLIKRNLCQREPVYTQLAITGPLFTVFSATGEGVKPISSSLLERQRFNRANPRQLVFSERTRCDGWKKALLHVYRRLGRVCNAQSRITSHARTVKQDFPVVVRK